MPRRNKSGHDRQKHKRHAYYPPKKIPIGENESITAFDMILNLIQARGRVNKPIPIKEIHQMRRSGIHNGKSADNIMFSAISTFNRLKGQNYRVYAEYQKKDKQVEFYPN